MPDAALEVARIEKAHGLGGEVVVKLTTNVTERLKPGSVLLLDADGRDSLEVVASRPHQHRYIVQFAGLTSREEADRFHGRTLFAEPFDEDADPDALWIHQLIGATVADQDGRDHGTVASVIDNPASDLLELDSGGLIPLRFVVSFADGHIVVDVPAGLLDDDEAVDDDPDHDREDERGDDEPEGAALQDTGPAPDVGAEPQG